MNFQITNIKHHHKNHIHKLIDKINQADNLGYSLTNEWLEYIIDSNSQGIFLAFHKDQLVGLGTAMINPVYKDQAALNIVVSPEYRKKGLGSILYDKVYHFTKSEDVKIVEAYVKSRLTNGTRFAEKRGFYTTLYSWEMELNLDNVGFVLEELGGLSFSKAKKEDNLNYKMIINNAFADKLGEDALKEALKDPSIIVYILKKDNQAVGSATVQLRENLSLAYIYDIAILKEYRGQGIGSYLLQSCVMTLKEKSIHKASLLVTGENKRALELYKKIGFKEVDMDLIMVKR